MANYGKYYIADHLLLKRYLEDNAGQNRIIKRWELEDLLREHDTMERSSAITEWAEWSA